MVLSMPKSYNTAILSVPLQKPKTDEYDKLATFR